MSANLENSAVATGLEKISFHSNPKEGQCQKNVQTTIQLLSFHMLTRLCSKSFKLGFCSMLTVKFQMYKLHFKEAEEPEIKLLTSVGSWRKPGSSRKTSTSASSTMLKPLTVWIHKLWKILKEMEYQTTLPAS